MPPTRPRATRAKWTDTHRRNDAARARPGAGVFVWQAPRAATTLIRMTDAPAPLPAPRPRIPALDIARTVALVCMAIYHFTVDLALFGVVAPDLPFTGFFRYFAHAIAGSFLFLVGISLVLAHRRKIRWRPWLKRLAQIVVGAALVSAATYADNPETYVFFGILHMIAAASLIGLPFLRAPIWLTLATAALAFIAPHYLRSTAFDAPWLLWLGLSSEIPRSIDFEPVFPWIGPVLLGIATARAGVPERLATTRAPGSLVRALSWPGRHSLAIYLVHQPVLFGLLWLWFKYIA